MNTLKMTLMGLMVAFTSSAFALNCEEGLKAIVADQLGVQVAQVKISSLTTEDLGADDVDMGELLMQLQDSFSIAIPNAQFDKLMKAQHGVSVQKLLGLVSDSKVCKELDSGVRTEIPGIKAFDYSRYIKN